MHYFDQGLTVLEVPGAPEYLPVWQISPYVHQGLVNNNLLRYENSSYDSVRHVVHDGHAIMGAMFGAPPGAINSTNSDTALLAALTSIQQGAPTEYLGDPMSNLFIPIFDSLIGPTKNQVVGVLNAMIHWTSYFRNILPDGVQPIVVVLEYQCNAPVDGEETTTYSVDNKERRQLKGPVTTKVKDPEELERLTTFMIIDESKNELVEGDDATGGDDDTTKVNEYWTVPETTEVPVPDLSASPSDKDAGSNSYWDISQVNGRAPTTVDPTAVFPVTASPSRRVPQSTDVPTTTATKETSGGGSEGEVLAVDEDGEGNSTETASFYDTIGSVDRPTFFTYIIQGSQADPVGFGDLHDPTFDKWMRQGNFSKGNLDDGTARGIPLDQRCTYHLYVYPTQSFYDSFITTTPVQITMGIMSVFIFAMILFGVYNRLVEKRQRKVLQKATQATALVASLFPKVRKVQSNRSPKRDNAFRYLLLTFNDGNHRTSEIGCYRGVTWWSQRAKTTQ